MSLKIPAFLQATQGVNGLYGGKGVQAPPPIDVGEPSGTNPFGGNLVGINPHIRIGYYQDGQIQAGYKLGGRTLAFA